MDGTLTQLLQALYEAHALIDTLRKRVAELEADKAKHPEALKT